MIGKILCFFGFHDMEALLLTFRRLDPGYFAIVYKCKRCAKQKAYAVYSKEIEEIFQKELEYAKLKEVK
jgi:hypothetical protein